MTIIKRSTKVGHLIIIDPTKLLMNLNYTITNIRTILIIQYLESKKILIKIIIKVSTSPRL